MKIVLLDTYYPRFLSSCYGAYSDLVNKSYEQQINFLLDQFFGTSNSYSRNLKKIGCDVQDLIVNCLPLQNAWAKENKLRYSAIALKIPQQLLRLPILGSWLSVFPGLVDVAFEQIKAMRPDVLYCQDLRFFTPLKLAKLRPYVKLIVGQIASPLPPKKYLKSYDLILTSFPHFVPQLKAMRISAEYFRIGFDDRVLDFLGEIEKDIDVSFVGGISRQHDKAIPMLEYLARNTPIEFFGYGAKALKRSSPILGRHHGELWGLDMYNALARSKVTLNRHINVASNYANNMRLYEATGVGSLLLTDRKDNLGELFEIGKEIAVYSSQEEAAEMIDYYLKHPSEREIIAKAGQARTLKEHTYKDRMRELMLILDRNLKHNEDMRK